MFSPGRLVLNKILTIHNSMVTTSLSLLDRLQGSRDAAAWNRFVELYTPLIYHSVQRVGVSAAEAPDLVQDVFLLLLNKLPEFDYDHRGSFGAWLSVITKNKCRDYLRKKRPTAGGSRIEEDGPTSPDNVELFSEAEYRCFVSRRALELMQTEFQPTTWKACWEHTVNGRPAAEIADELGISVNAVYIAKTRVLRRLREELDQLME